jgi:hypothetical protein
LDRTKTTARAKDRGDVAAAKKLQQIRGALLGGAGKITVARENVGA